MGGCGWSRCPRNRNLSHVAKGMAYSWFVAVGIWSFWGRIGPFPGHIMELEGRKELVDTGKSSRMWSVPTVSLRLAVLNVFQGFFGPKMAVFGPKLQFLKLRSATCESRSRPPPLSFLLKLSVIVLHTHRYHPRKFQLNLKHHDGVLIFPHFARAVACLLLACLLLLAAAAAKPGRSTLDTKKGYKTKTGSTSSVTLTLTLGLTLTLIKTEYWDRAGGGGNISYDW